MVAYCVSCRRYVNQSCDRCQGSYGVKMCEWYACGGKMVCPICGGNDLTAKMEYSADPYDFSKHKDRTMTKGGAQKDIQAKYFAEQRLKEGMAEKKVEAPTKGERHCPLCGYTISEPWKFCPECGVSLLKK